ncbi:MAG: tripartite tricarboxylate transporter substrate binding protein [Polyangiaceae bacterium]
MLASCLFAVALVTAASTLGGAGGCARAPARPATSTGDAYPSRPLRLIVPFPAGGGADFWGRLLASKLTETLGEPVVVDDVPGMGGNTGTAAAARAPADGYTLLLGSTGPLAVHPFTYDTLPFDPDEDFVPVALLESSPIVLVVHPSVHASSLSELVALAKTRPGGLTFASNGNGSPEEIAGALFDRRLGLEIRHVPFDGAGPARSELAKGGVSMMFDPCKAALPAIQRGKERALAVASEARLGSLPDVPTFGDVGLRDFELRIWTGVLAPKGTPPDAVAALSRAIREALDTPDMRKAMADQGSEPGCTSPEGFAELLRSERARWKRLVAESGVATVRGPI